MISRVLATLDAVAEAPGCDRAALAKATGLPQPTSNRIVARLVAERLLAERSGGLRLGLRLFELGTEAAQGGVTLLDVAGPYLVDLHRALGWTAQLAVLDGDAVVYLLKIDGRHRSRLGTRVAGRFPPHCTGAGKALLAYGPPELLTRLGTLSPRTRKSITDPEQLVAELRATRRRGYSVDLGEFQDGMAGVAVPVRPRGRLVGAVTLAGPVEAFDVPRAAHAARVVAQLIAARLGSQPA